MPTAAASCRFPISGVSAVLIRFARLPPYVRRLIKRARGCVSGTLYRPSHTLSAFRRRRTFIVGRLAFVSSIAVPTVREHPITACPPILCTRSSTLCALYPLACTHKDDACRLQVRVALKSLRVTDSDTSVTARELR